LITALTTQMRWLIMNKAFQAILARILDPLALCSVALDDDETSFARKPRPEPEIIGSPRYHQRVTDQNFIAAARLQEKLLALEAEVLLTCAASYAVILRARAVRPLILCNP
jgi:hypothetical protein